MHTKRATEIWERYLDERTSHDEINDPVGRDPLEQTMQLARRDPDAHAQLQRQIDAPGGRAAIAGVQLLLQKPGSKLPAAMRPKAEELAIVPAGEPALGELKRSGIKPCKLFAIDVLPTDQQGQTKIPEASLLGQLAMAEQAGELLQLAKNSKRGEVQLWLHGTGRLLWAQVDSGPQRSWDDLGSIWWQLRRIEACLCLALGIHTPKRQTAGPERPIWIGFFPKGGQQPSKVLEIHHPMLLLRGMQQVKQRDAESTDMLLDESTCRAIGARWIPANSWGQSEGMQGRWTKDGQEAQERGKQLRLRPAPGPSARGSNEPCSALMLGREKGRDWLATEEGSRWPISMTGLMEVAAPRPPDPEGDLEGFLEMIASDQERCTRKWRSVHGGAADVAYTSFAEGKGIEETVLPEGRAAIWHQGEWPMGMGQRSVPTRLTEEDLLPWPIEIDQSRWNMQQLKRLHPSWCDVHGPRRLHPSQLGGLELALKMVIRDCANAESRTLALQVAEAYGISSASWAEQGFPARTLPHRIFTVIERAGRHSDGGTNLFGVDAHALHVLQELRSKISRPMRMPDSAISLLFQRNPAAYGMSILLLPASEDAMLLIREERLEQPGTFRISTWNAARVIHPQVGELELRQLQGFDHELDPAGAAQRIASKLRHWDAELSAKLLMLLHAKLGPALTPAEGGEVARYIVQTRDPRAVVGIAIRPQEVQWLTSIAGCENQPSIDAIEETIHHLIAPTEVGGTIITLEKR